MSIAKLPQGGNKEGHHRDDLLLMVNYFFTKVNSIHNIVLACTFQFMLDPYYNIHILGHTYYTVYIEKHTDELDTSGTPAVTVADIPISNPRV